MIKFPEEFTKEELLHTFQHDRSVSKEELDVMLQFGQRSVDEEEQLMLMSQEYGGEMSNEEILKMQRHEKQMQKPRKLYTKIESKAMRALPTGSQFELPQIEYCLDRFKTGIPASRSPLIPTIFRPRI
jgi:hypothetical protein